MNDYDWHDYGKVQEFYNERCEKYMDLSMKWVAVRESGDKKKKERALKAMSKHRTQDEEFKEKAKQAYFYWY